MIAPVLEAAMKPPRRRGLRGSLEVRAGPAAVQTRHVDREIRHRAPDAIQRETAPGLPAAVVDVDVTVDRDIRRRPTWSRHFGLITDLDDEGFLGAAVGAGLIQEGVPVRAHLIIDLRGRNGIDGGLNVGHGHAGVEDSHVWSEVRGGRHGCRFGRRGESRIGNQPGAGRQDDQLDSTGAGDDLNPEARLLPEPRVCGHAARSEMGWRHCWSCSLWRCGLQCAAKARSTGRTWVVTAR